jgi:hypothetical protein
MNSDVDLKFKEAFMAISKLKEPVAARRRGTCVK